MVDGRLFTANVDLGHDEFSANGHYLGPADVPEDLDRFLFQEITAEAIYGIARDELDVQHAVRLAIR